MRAAPPKWPLPHQPNTFPELTHVIFNLTAGDFAGDFGTLDLTTQDAAGNNGLIHVELTTRQNEKCIADLNIVNGRISAKDQVALPDGTDYTEIDTTQPDGSMVCTIDFPDNSEEVLSMNPDGTMDEVLKGPDGSVEATGLLAEDGMDALTFEDGSTEDVDVDTADAGDGGSGDPNSDKHTGGLGRNIRPAARKDS